MTEASLKLAVWVRLWHASTALLFLILVITGLVLHYSSPDFVLIDYALATEIHDISGIVLAILYVLYLPYIFGTGYWRQYVPRVGGLGRRLITQIRIYIADREHEKPPETKREQSRFNALQQLTYFIVLFGLLPLLIGTGLIYLYYPDYVPDHVLGMAGLWPIALAHYALSIFATLYLVTHVYMAITGQSASARFKLMLNGRLGSDQK